MSKLNVIDAAWPRNVAIVAATVMRLGTGTTAMMIANINNVEDAPSVTRAHRGAGTTNHEPITMQRKSTRVVIACGPRRRSNLATYGRNHHSFISESEGEPWMGLLVSG